MPHERNQVLARDSDQLCPVGAHEEAAPRMATHERDQVRTGDASHRYQLLERLEDSVTSQPDRHVSTHARDPVRRDRPSPAYWTATAVLLNVTSSLLVKPTSDSSRWSDLTTLSSSRQPATGVPITMTRADLNAVRSQSDRHGSTH